MKLELEGECTEVRKKLTGEFQSEIRFQIEGEDINIRIPQKLTFGQRVNITIETMGGMTAALGGFPDVNTQRAHYAGKE